MLSFDYLSCAVSTHSRLKAAGKAVSHILSKHYCFNTQPPEGGWVCFLSFDTAKM